MYIDKQLLMSEGQAITATAYSTNVLDLGSADAGKSDDLFLLVKTGSSAFNTLTSLDISLGTSSTEAFSSETILFKVNILLAGLTANTDLIRVKLPVGMLRYARMTYTVNGSNPSQGALTAGLVQQVQTNP